MKTRKRKASVFVASQPCRIPPCCIQITCLQFCLQTEFEETANPVARALGEIFYMTNALVVVVYKINFIHFVIKAWPPFIDFYDPPLTYTWPKRDTQFYFVFSVNI